MLIADIDINVNEVTDISYNKETGLVTINWAREYAGSSNPSYFSKTVGSKALNLKRFINEVIDATNNKRGKEIEKYMNILKNTE